MVSKVWATYASRCELGLEKSLKSLGLDYVDLYLVHWPLLMNPHGNDDRFPKLPNGERDIIHSHNHVETWKQMERLVVTGKTRGIGVCNVSFGVFSFCNWRKENFACGELILSLDIVQQALPRPAPPPRNHHPRR